MNENTKIDRTTLLSELIKKTKYSEYLENLGKEYPDLKSLMSKIKKSNLSLTEWENLTINIGDINSLKLLANPYFIGYGNPNSEVLIIGKEKAFDVCSNPELLFLESISNVSQWKKIIDNKTRRENSVELIFDPRFPRGYHTKANKKSHTWNKYSLFLSKFIEEDKTNQTLFDETQNRLNSLFNYCFCTELNSIPSKKTKNISTSQDRRKFLSNEFYKDFKYVLIAGVSTFGKRRSQQEEEIEKIYNAKFKDSITLGTYGQNKSRKANIYKSGKQIIVTCAQLSGSAGWKTEHILNLGSEMKKMNLEKKNF